VGKFKCTRWFDDEIKPIQQAGRRNL